MILIVGDSHCLAIGRAMVHDAACVPQALRKRHGRIAAKMVLPGFRFKERFFEEQDDGIALLHGASELMAELTGTDGIIRKSGDVYGFSFGLHTSIMIRQKFWADFTLLPGVTAKSYISQAAFRELVINENQHTLAFAREMKRREIPSFFLVAPPLRRAMIIRQAGIAAESELKEVYRAYVATMRAEFGAIGTVLLQPPDVIGSDDVLKPQYDNQSANDVHHANTAFGSLVWKEIGIHLEDL